MSPGPWRWAQTSSSAVGPCSSVWRRLALEVFQASVVDESYGHIVEAIKSSVGIEHENKLKGQLRKRDIAYQVRKNDQLILVPSELLASCEI